MNLWYPFTLSHICKMINTLLKPFNRIDIKRLIFLQCRACFCQNKEKHVTKRYQRYTCLRSHNFLNFEPISKILFVFSFRYIALSNSCIWYQFRPANKNSFALLVMGEGGVTPRARQNQRHVCPAKTWNSLGIRPVWSVFDVRMKTAWVLGYPLSAQRRLIRIPTTWGLCLKMVCIMY